MKTTYPIELKLKGFIERVNDGLYTDFQSILKIDKNFIIFNFKAYRCLIWSCKYPYTLKELKNWLI